VTDTPPVSGEFLTHNVALAIVMHLRNLKSVASSQKTITLPRPRPFRGLPFGMGLSVIDLLAKFKHSRNIDELKFIKGSRDPDHAHFDVKFLLLGLELP